MINYWKELKIPDTWGKIERYNYLMNYINNINGSSSEKVDYWCKLPLSAKWGKDERFNFIMNYIDNIE